MAFVDDESSQKLSIVQISKHVIQLILDGINLHLQQAHNKSLLTLMEIFSGVMKMILLVGASL